MKYTQRIFSGSLLALASVIVLPALAFAHVVVTPSQVGIGVNTLYNLSVPNEKDVAVTSVKLLIPNGVQNVSPDVMGGWTITITTNGTNDIVSAITWTGTIPAGQRADLAFKAQSPAKATNLDWKAYQTYADGTVVSWTQNPDTNGKTVKDNIGPYSMTAVTDDLSSTAQPPNNTATLALIASIAALIFSLVSLFLHRKRR
jgi:uncharacterized protein YcnI